MRTNLLLAFVFAAPLGAAADTSCFQSEPQQRPRVQLLWPSEEGEPGAIRVNGAETTIFCTKTLPARCQLVEDNGPIELIGDHGNAIVLARARELEAKRDYKTEPAYARSVKSDDGDHSYPVTRLGKDQCLKLFGAPSPAARFNPPR